jgi:hypothetical protein
MNAFHTRAVVIVTFAIALTACHGGVSGPQARRIDWQASPLDLNLRGMDGSRYRFDCPPGKPMPDLVTGTGIYTDASSICSAAVHAGAIDAQRGGQVVIQILAGQARYQGSTQNFVHSHDYPRPWGGSFAVLGGPGRSSSP